MKGRLRLLAQPPLLSRLNGDSQKELFGLLGIIGQDLCLKSDTGTRRKIQQELRSLSIPSLGRRTEKAFGLLINEDPSRLGKIFPNIESLNAAGVPAFSDFSRAQAYILTEEIAETPFARGAKIADPYVDVADGDRTLKDERFVASDIPNIAESLASLPRLRNLTIPLVYFKTRKDLILKQIQALKLTNQRYGSTTIEERGSYAYMMISRLPKLPQLKHLKFIAHTRLLTDDEFEVVNNWFRELETLVWRPTRMNSARKEGRVFFFSLAQCKKIITSSLDFDGRQEVLGSLLNMKEITVLDNANMFVDNNPLYPSSILTERKRNKILSINFARNIRLDMSESEFVDVSDNITTLIVSPMGRIQNPSIVFNPLSKIIEKNKDWLKELCLPKNNLTSIINLPLPVNFSTLVSLTVRMQILEFKPRQSKVLSTKGEQAKTFNFPNLRYLSLTTEETIMHESPRLEANLRITAPNLRHLVLIDREHPYAEASRGEPTIHPPFVALMTILSLFFSNCPFLTSLHIKTKKQPFANLLQHPLGFSIFLKMPRTVEILSITNDIDTVTSEMCLQLARVMNDVNLRNVVIADSANLVSVISYDENGEDIPPTIHFTLEFDLPDIYTLPTKTIVVVPSQLRRVFPTSAGFKRVFNRMAPRVECWALVGGENV